MKTLLNLDPADLARAYDDVSLGLRHAAHGHPLLTLEALAELTGRHPEGAVEHNLGNVPAQLPSGDAPRSALSPREIVRGIEDNGCWMVIKHIESDPDYRALMDRALDEVTRLLPSGEIMTRREGFIFVSAPGAVTPSHIDPEHNLLLQVAGTKTLHAGRFATADAQEHELERFYAGDHRNIAALPHDATAHVLEAGDGVYVPPDTPHWVQNGAATSISLSVTFYTPAVDRRALVFRANHRLRSLGMRPRPPGAHELGDHAKATAVRASRLARKARGRVAATLAGKLEDLPRPASARRHQALGAQRLAAPDRLGPRADAQLAQDVLDV